MRHRYALLITAVSCLTVLPAHAHTRYVGQTLRVTGIWRDGSLGASRIQLREHDWDRAQIAGSVAAVDRVARTLRIGPVTVHWSAETKFEDIGEDGVAEGRLLRVSGTLIASAVLQAARIEKSDSSWSRDELQLTATVSDSRSLGGQGSEVTMMGLPVRFSRAGYNRDDSLTRRQDSRRPDRPLTLDFAGRPLRITGEYEMSLRRRRNLVLDDSDGTQVRDDISHDLQLEFFLPWSDRLFFFAEAEAAHENEFHRSDGDDESQGALARGQSWVYIDGLANNRVGLHLGRQNLRETREWWWDDDLDAARVVYDDGPLHAYAGVARELGRVFTRDDGIDPEHEDVDRFFGSGSWLWSARQSLEVFALHQNDRSSRPAMGQRVRQSRQDESDADLTWLGLRAIGQRSLGASGSLRYWADLAYVRGRELAFGFDESDAVATRVQRDVEGFGLDLGASWQTRLPGRPAFTVGFARGSGDSDPDDGDDGSFHQTGLNANKWRFHGVNRFRYYGEVLRPELSNLDVFTLAAGTPFWQNSSVELVYHHYRQVKPAASLRDVRVNADLDGEHRHVGDGIDLVIGIREGRHVDLALTAGWFRSGSAYGQLEGKNAWLLNLEFVLFF